jgi:hypothetical protein
MPPGQPTPPQRIPMAVDLQSRDGSLTYDGRMANAYVEKTQDGFRVYKRSGLSYGYPTAGSAGFGMTSIIAPSGTESLWVATAAGTFYQIAGGSYSGYILLVAGSHDYSGVTGYGYDPVNIAGSSVNPTSYSSAAIELMVFGLAGGSGATLYLAGTRAQDFFTTMTAGGTAFNSADATYNGATSPTTWVWGSGSGIAATGTYYVYFT